MICIELADNVKQEFVVELDTYPDAAGCASAFLKRSLIR
jgi:hypothetical protein